MMTVAESKLLLMSCYMSYMNFFIFLPLSLLMLIQWMVQQLHILEIWHFHRERRNQKSLREQRSSWSCNVETNMTKEIELDREFKVIYDPVFVFILANDAKHLINLSTPPAVVNITFYFQMSSYTFKAFHRIDFFEYNYFLKRQCVLYCNEKYVIK